MVIISNIRLSETARSILEKRYLKRNEHGRVIEKPEDLLRRVAYNIALADIKYTHRNEIDALRHKHKKEFYDLIYIKEFQQ